MKEEAVSHPIVFFDGVCSLCNAAIDFLLRIDRRHRFAIASLQGETAAKLLPAALRESLSTLVVRQTDGALAVKSRALLAIAAALPWPWRALLIFRILPRSLLDFFYDQLAARRYRWFPQRKACRRPSEEEESYFLA